MVRKLKKQPKGTRKLTKDMKYMINLDIYGGGYYGYKPNWLFFKTFKEAKAYQTRDSWYPTVVRYIFRVADMDKVLPAFYNEYGKEELKRLRVG